ncbi:MAG TPA: outer membrane lipoprotein-sorting protein [Caldithrix sp.]|nr:outer membrane lipoprotein-sorting protein [Caldithrix sp.]
MKLAQLVFSTVFFLFETLTFAQDAQSIIEKADSVVNAPKDQKATMKMVLVDKKGNEKVRETQFLQKGDEKRIMRFTAPADQKGIAFLGLPDDIQYLYMPAFHKVRRIASHVKNTKFAGTDFTYDDLSSFEYAEDYNAKLLSEDEQHWVMELIPKADVKKDYGKLKMWVRKDNYYPEKIEHYDKGGNLWKVMERRQITKIGNYWISKEMEMKDLKQQHSTKMLLENMEFDIGLSDKLFTQRYLKRAK